MDYAPLGRQRTQLSSSTVFMFSIQICTANRSVATRAVQLLNNQSTLDASSRQAGVI